MRPIYTVRIWRGDEDGTYSWKDMTNAPRIDGGALHISSSQDNSKKLTSQQS
jgi:hypothetical protein